MVVQVRLTDGRGLTAFLEYIQAGVRDVVIPYILVILPLLTESSDENGVVLRGDEGDGIEIDESRHDHGSYDDPIEVTLASKFKRE